MSNLQDLINLAKADGGKFFVMDETGEAKLVIMSVEDYERLLLGKLQKQIREQELDAEKINREILKAQLQDTPAQAAAPSIPKPKFSGPNVSENKPLAHRPDLREEVIDPSFDFEGPKMEIDDL